MLSARRRSPPVALDVLAGAAAGAIGTSLMSPTQQAATRLQGPASQQREQRASLEKNATELVAERIARPFGVRLRGDALKRAGLAVHFGQGMSMGILFALLSRRRRVLPFGAGLLFAFGLWLFGDEIAVPVLGFGAPPRKYPPSTHAKALAAHLAYGVGLESTFRIARAIGA